MNILKILCHLYFISFKLFYTESKSVYKRIIAGSQGNASSSILNTPIHVHEGKDVNEIHPLGDTTSADRPSLPNHSGKVGKHFFEYISNRTILCCKGL